ncbi:apolipoprotein D [Battus philenor]|uniref:apolipoprotein D n=1 Tax=Battus philenor TaxID=42288 RepID=UPI0035CFEEDC
MLRAIICLCFVTIAVGQVIRVGPCVWENRTSGINFNFTGMLGEWHQIRRIPNPEETGQCSTLNLEVNATIPLPVVKITHKEVHDKHLHTRVGQIVPKNMSLEVFSIIYDNLTYDSVVALTDYAKYAVLYSCMPIPSSNNSAVVAWVYGRNTSLSQIDATIVQAFISGDEDLRNASWVETSHTKDACSTSGSVISQLSPIVGFFCLMIFGRKTLISC